MAVREYIGARYVPKFSDLNNGDWDNQYSYEALEIVKNGNDFYTAKIPVPPGVAISDTTYWALTGNYNGAISTLQQEIDAINATVKTPELFGAVGDGVTDDTAAINSALAGGGLVVFKAGATYLVDPDVSLKPDNNSILELNGATIKAKPVSSDYYEIIYIEKVANVVVRNGIIIGERDNHLGTTGEWGMGIYVGGSNDVLIDNMNISKCWGDGIYIGEPTDYSNIVSHRVKITNCNIYTCRRQGISVVWAEDVTIRGNFIHDISGTSPESCIDIEPNASQTCKKVVVDGNIFYSNRVGVMTMGGSSPYTIEDIVISNNVFKMLSGNSTAANLSGKGVQFVGNSISGTSANGQAVVVQGEYNSVCSNHIYDMNSKYLMYLYHAYHNTISDNNIENVTLSGSALYVSNSDNNQFTGNTFEKISTTAANDYLAYLRGISGETSDANIFEGNSVRDAVFKHLIYFGGNSADNEIVNNKFSGTYDYCIVEAATETNYVEANIVKSGSSGFIYGTVTNVQNIVDHVLVP